MLVCLREASRPGTWASGGNRGFKAVGPFSLYFLLLTLYMDWTFIIPSHKAVYIIRDVLRKTKIGRPLFERQRKAFSLFPWSFFKPSMDF